MHDKENFNLMILREQEPMTLVSWRELKLFFLVTNIIIEQTSVFRVQSRQIKTNYKFFILFTDKKGYTS